MSELTCENCFWYKHQYEIHGRCRNPRNASIGSAGSDYSSSELLKPMDVKINMVCDLHELAGASANLRKVYEVEPVPRDWREGFKANYRTEWRRKAPSPQQQEMK
jgi:hypothetical protein